MATTPTRPAWHFPVASRQRISRQRLRQLLRTHPLGAFFGVTFAFSWVCEIVAFGLLDLDFVIGVLPAIFGPALGAYVVIRSCDGSAGVHAWMRRLLLWRVDWRLYLFALGALPGLVIAA